MVISPKSKKNTIEVYKYVFTYFEANLINERSDNQVGDILSDLNENQKVKVVELMNEIKNILNHKNEE